MTKEQITTVCNFNLTHQDVIVVKQGEKGGPVSHGICPGCRDKMMSNIVTETAAEKPKEFRAACRCN